MEEYDAKFVVNTAVLQKIQVFWGVKLCRWKVLRSSETSETTRPTTRCHIPGHFIFKTYEVLYSLCPSANDIFFIDITYIPMPFYSTNLGCIFNTKLRFR